MKFFVTGVGGQLGHDVMNELLKRGHEGVGSDIQEKFSVFCSYDREIQPVLVPHKVCKTGTFRRCYVNTVC